MTNHQSEKIEVFISYSQQDKELRDGLLSHLRPLKNEGIISWYDRQILPGTQWDDEIKARLNSADIILLLISADFLATDYCTQVEIPEALRRHQAGEAIVMPVILRHCGWEYTPLAKIQAYPEKAKPIKSWTDIDAAYLDVVRGVYLAATAIKKRRQAAQEQLQQEQQRQAEEQERQRQAARLKQQAEAATAPTKVFISYSWDTDQHKESVLALANTLRDPWGIEADLDQYVRATAPYTPVQGWDLWMEKRIEWAEFVLIVCTETYKRRFRGDEEPGKGVTWEGTIIRQELYNAQLKNTKFIPVVFSSQDLIQVPIILNGNDKYILEDETSFRSLCSRLRKEPTIAIPNIAVLNPISPPTPKFFSPQKPQAEPPPVLLNDAEVQASTSIQRELGQQGDQTVSTDELASEKGVDYTQLETLLKAGQWQAADQETAKRMCEVMGRQQENWFRDEDLQNFPCTDLHTIDQLWVKHSKNQFGFSIQKKIWQDCYSLARKIFSWESWCETVGWKKKGKGLVGDWLSYSELTFDLSAHQGHLPCSIYFVLAGLGGVGTIQELEGDEISSLSRRLVDCSR